MSILNLPVTNTTQKRRRVSKIKSRSRENIYWKLGFGSSSLMTINLRSKILSSCINPGRKKHNEKETQVLHTFHELEDHKIIININNNYDEKETLFLFTHWKFKDCLRAELLFFIWLVFGCFGQANWSTYWFEFKASLEIATTTAGSYK